MAHRVENSGKLPQPDETELVAKLAAHDNDAWRFVLEQYRPMMLGVARRILNDEAEAEDTVQQVCLEVLERLSQFDATKGTFIAWLRELTRCRALDVRRNLSRRPLYWAISDDRVTDELARTDGPENLRWKQELFAALEPEERQAIILKYERGYTDKEIAALTGDSPRTVRHTLARSRRKLKSLFHDRETSG